MPTNTVDIPNQINTSAICQYLTSTENEINRQFNGGTLSSRIPRLLYITRDSMEWGYSNFNGAASLSAIANFNISLCRNIGKAKIILGNATGIIVGTGSSNNPNQLTEYRKYPQFIVGAAGAPMQDGDDTLIINDAQAAPGFVKAFVDEGEQGEALSDRVSWTSVWEVGKITVKWNQGLAEGTLMNPEYPITTNLTISQSSTQDLNYYATLNGVETKSLLSTSGQIFLTPANTLSVISFTLFCSDAQGERLTLVWRGQVFNDGGSITVVESDRTVIGINDFGDDFFNNIVIAGDNSFQGLRVTLTGITDKIINCVAKFRVDSTDL